MAVCIESERVVSAMINLMNRGFAEFGDESLPGAPELAAAALCMTQYLDQQEGKENGNAGRWVANFDIGLAFGRAPHSALSTLVRQLLSPALIGGIAAYTNANRPSWFLIQ